MTPGLTKWMINQLLVGNKCEVTTTSWDLYYKGNDEFVQKFMNYFEDEMCAFVTKCIADNPDNVFVKTDFIQDWIGNQIKNGQLTNKEFIESRAMCQYRDTVYKYTDWVRKENARYNRQSVLAEHDIPYNAELLDFISKEANLWETFKRTNNEPTGLDYIVRYRHQRHMNLLKEQVTTYREHLLHVWYAKFMKVSHLFMSGQSFADDWWFNTYGIPFVQHNLSQESSFGGSEDLLLHWNQFFVEKYSDIYFQYISMQSHQSAVVCLYDSSDEDAPEDAPEDAGAADSESSDIVPAHGVGFAQLKEPSSGQQNKPSKRKASCNGDRGGEATETVPVRFRY